ncbi:MAG: DUF6931 family protein [Marivita sp.]|uniref:DUF6931 family protein n=1 Tax=Marivita sp. TaxID=2003365 RepID=UPI003EF4E101
MTASQDDSDFDQTIPPQSSLRYDRPYDLYRGIPEISGFTRHRPTEDEDPLGYLDRLRSSTTPEDAITYTAFATEPRVAIQWGLNAVRMTLPDIPPDEVQLMSWVTQWIEHPTTDNRWRTLQVALFAPRRSPAVYLGLAVGWSGGPLAPNDPVSVPEWRSPRAVNAAVLRAVGQVGLAERSVRLARILDLATGLFRVY